MVGLVAAAIAIAAGAGLVALAGGGGGGAESAAAGPLACASAPCLNGGGCAEGSAWSCSCLPGYGDCSHRRGAAISLNPPPLCG